MYKGHSFEIYCINTAIGDFLLCIFSYCVNSHKWDWGQTLGYGLTLRSAYIVISVVHFWSKRMKPVNPKSLRFALNGKLNLLALELIGHAWDHCSLKQIQWDLALFTEIATNCQLYHTISNQVIGRTAAMTAINPSSSACWGSCLAKCTCSPTKGLP